MELNFGTFVGQAALKAEARRRMSLASEIGEPMPHLLLCGSPEMGKATFASAIAGEIGARISGPILATDTKKWLDFVCILSNVHRNEFVVVEEIGLLKPDLAESLTEVLSDRVMRLSVGVGWEARIVAMDLNPFTMVVTTSRPWQIPQSFRRWFVAMNFEPYNTEEIADVLSRLVPNCRRRRIWMESGICPRTCETGRVRRELWHTLISAIRY